MTKKKHQLLGERPRSKLIERMIRVNHAGEYGAVRIYQGQLKVLSKKNISNTVSEMLEQEKKHLKQFEEEIKKRRVRPTALLPIWHVCGFALGAGSALLGEKGAMACTAAVEEVIDAHYSGQIKLLGDNSDEEGLKEKFEEFRKEEAEHRDVALESGSAKMRGNLIFSCAIKAGSRIAIWLSTRV